MAITKPLERKKMVKEGKKISLSETNRSNWNHKRQVEKNDGCLHQDPVPRLCVILKDFHDHLTSLNYQSGIPVGRVLRVYGMMHWGIPCQLQYYSLTYSLDSIHEILGISHFSTSVVKLRVVSNCYHTSFLTQSWKTSAGNWIGKKKIRWGQLKGLWSLKILDMPELSRSIDRQARDPTHKACWGSAWLGRDLTWEFLVYPETPYVWKDFDNPKSDAI